jgi:hypothetical protein
VKLGWLAHCKQSKPEEELRNVSVKNVIIVTIKNVQDVKILQQIQPPV